MNSQFKKLIYYSALLILLSCNATVGHENTLVSIKTSIGEIKVKLYDETPLHRDNFIRLIKSGFYEGLSFHRVIKNFMIQAGDPETRSVDLNSKNDTLKTYTIPSEFNSRLFHKKGALAAARHPNEVNPYMRSSGTQFYIVQGVKYTDQELDQEELRINGNIKQWRFSLFIKEISDSIRIPGISLTDAEIQELASIRMFQYLAQYRDLKFTEEQRNAYKTIGGVPRLDGTYTVFGEVIEGLDVAEKIAQVPTSGNDKPVSDIIILKVKIINK